MDNESHWKPPLELRNKKDTDMLTWASEIPLREGENIFVTLPFQVLKFLLKKTPKSRSLLKMFDLFFIRTYFV